jgi:hypothetical protein
VLDDSHNQFSDFDSADDIRTTVKDLTSALSSREELTDTSKSHTKAIIDRIVGPISDSGGIGTISSDEVSSLLGSYDASISNLSPNVSIDRDVIKQTFSSFAELYSTGLVPSQETQQHSLESIKMAASIVNPPRSSLSDATSTTVQAISVALSEQNNGGKGVSVALPVVPIDSNTMVSPLRAVIGALNSSLFEQPPKKENYSTISDIVSLKLTDTDSLGSCPSDVIFRLPIDRTPPRLRSIVHYHNCTAEHPVRTVECNGKMVPIDCGSTGIANITLELYCEYQPKRTCEGLDGTACRVISYTDDETVCSCEFCPSVDGGGDLDSRRLAGIPIAMEVVAMSSFVITDFIEVTSNLDKLGLISTYAKATRVLASFAFVVFSMFFIFFLSECLWSRFIKNKPKEGPSFDGALSERGLINREDNSQSNQYINQDIHGSGDKEDEEKKEEEKTIKELSDYLSSVFIGVFSLENPRNRLLDEIIRNHLVVKVFLAKRFWDRFDNLLEFLTVIFVSMYAIALLTNLELQKDDGSCTAEITEEGCIALVSIFDVSTERCEWAPVDGWYDYDPGYRCEFIVPELSIVSYLVIIFIAACLSLPFRIITSFLFDGLIRAPVVKDIVEEDLEDGSTGKQRRPSMLNRAGSFVGGAMRKGAEIIRRGSNAILPINGNNKARWTGGKDIKLLEKAVIIPENVKEVRFIAMTRLAKTELQSPGSGCSDSSSSSSTSSMSNADRQGGNTNEGDFSLYSLDENTMFKNLFDKFMSYVMAEVKCNNHLPEIFFDQWDAAVYLEGTKTTAHFNDRISLISRFNQMLRFAEVNVKNLRRYPESAAGIELIRIFAMDLLGFGSPEAKIFEKHTETHFRLTRVVSWHIKVFAYVGVFLLNLYCISNVIVFAEIHGEEWQIGWSYIAYIYIILMCTLEMTFESYFLGYYLPNQIADQVRAVQIILRESVAAKRREAKMELDASHSSSSSSSSSTTTAASNRGGGLSGVIDPETKAALDFSCTDHIFASNLIARQFPLLPESALVLSYRNPLPHRGKILPSKERLRELQMVENNTVAKVTNISEDDNDNQPAPVGSTELRGIAPVPGMRTPVERRSGMITNANANLRSRKTDRSSRVTLSNLNAGKDYSVANIVGTTSTIFGKETSNKIEEQMLFILKIARKLPDKIISFVSCNRLDSFRSFVLCVGGLPLEAKRAIIMAPFPLLGSLFSTLLLKFVGEGNQLAVDMILILGGLGVVSVLASIIYLYKLNLDEKTNQDLQLAMIDHEITLQQAEADATIKIAKAKASAFLAEQLAIEALEAEKAARQAKRDLMSKRRFAVNRRASSLNSQMAMVIALDEDRASSTEEDNDENSDESHSSTELESVPIIDRRMTNSRQSIRLSRVQSMRKPMLSMRKPMLSGQTTTTNNNDREKEEDEEEDGSDVDVGAVEMGSATVVGEGKEVTEGRNGRDKGNGRSHNKTESSRHHHHHHHHKKSLKRGSSNRNNSTTRSIKSGGVKLSSKSRSSSTQFDVVNENDKGHRVDSDDDDDDDDDDTKKTSPRQESDKQSTKTTFNPKAKNRKRKIKKTVYLAIGVKGDVPSSQDPPHDQSEFLNTKFRKTISKPQTRHLTKQKSTKMKRSKTRNKIFNTDSDHVDGSDRGGNSDVVDEEENHKMLEEKKVDALNAAAQQALECVKAKEQAVTAEEVFKALNLLTFSDDESDK